MFKPMKAAQNDPKTDPNFFKKLVFPLMVSPKLDGIRSVNRNGIMTSNSNKPLPNKHMQLAFSEVLHCDGEFIVGDPTASDVYNKTQSIVMSRDKPIDDLSFFIFDYVTDETKDIPYSFRLEHAESACSYYADSGMPVVLVKQHEVHSVEQLLELEEKALHDGFEGIMMRSPHMPYKYGRSTFNEQGLLKLKRFEDVEAIVVGFEEQMTNTNASFKDEQGYSTRSSAKGGMQPAGTLGKIIVDYNGMILFVAPGAMKHDERKVVWEDQDSYLGRYITMRFFAYGVKDKPRFPRFVGWRAGVGIDV